MDLHLYSGDDLRNSQSLTIDGNEYKFSFIADVPGDNPDVFGEFDNHELADRLQRFKAIGDDDRLDCEMCCFYIYFQRKEDGLAFIQKLNAYISQRSRLLREAEAF